jgi:hypothetical protein
MEELLTFLNEIKDNGDKEQICKNLLLILKQNYGKLRKFKFSQKNYKLHYNGTLEERTLIFKMEVIKYIGDEYSKDLCESFFLYWTQPTHDLKKLAFEREPTWSIKSRLNTFKSRRNNWKNQ